MYHLVPDPEYSSVWLAEKEKYPDYPEMSQSGNAPTYNILMYSHDTYGLGHIRRTMAIADNLRNSQANVLILTGSPIAGRFKFPQQVDFVRIPGMIKKTNDEYQSLSIRIDQEKALEIRTNIILATAKTFNPDLFIVDKEPLGLKKEVLPTLEWLREKRPQCRAVLGLRDILDDAGIIQKDWHDKDIYRHLEELYDEIWIYGNRSVYDAVHEYRIPESIHPKVHFTGYIRRKNVRHGKRALIRRKYRILDEDSFVMVTTGGGGDGYEVIDHFLAMHDYYPASLPLKSIIVTGPFMPKETREKIRKRAKKYGIRSIPFHPRPEELMVAADVVISMGGYNTICEILSNKTPAIIIPRETPRTEQLIRARRLKEEGLLDFIPWKEVTPQLLRQKIFSLLRDKDLYRRRIEAFDLSGLDNMLKRLHQFKKVT